MSLLLDGFCLNEGQKSSDIGKSGKVEEDGVSGTSVNHDVFDTGISLAINRGTNEILGDSGHFFGDFLLF